eukprot:GHVU01035743.1.p1 GENE.GHVU01035743.1~~GHVU01035743.1.p1  ORF type:complete len:366 (+),score=33.86 GHVU01035743.1:61-1158(+)
MMTVEQPANVAFSRPANPLQAEMSQAQQPLGVPQQSVGQPGFNPQSPQQRNGGAIPNSPKGADGNRFQPPSLQQPSGPAGNLAPPPQQVSQSPQRLPTSNYPQNPIVTVASPGGGWNRQQQPQINVGRASEQGMSPTSGGALPPQQAARANGRGRFSPQEVSSPRGDAGARRPTLATAASESGRMARRVSGNDPEMKAPSEADNYRFYGQDSNYKMETYSTQGTKLQTPGHNAACCAPFDCADGIKNFIRRMHATLSVVWDGLMEVPAFKFIAGLIKQFFQGCFSLCNHVKCQTVKGLKRAARERALTHGDELSRTISNFMDRIPDDSPQQQYPAPLPQQPSRMGTGMPNGGQVPQPQRNPFGAN